MKLEMNVSMLTEKQIGHDALLEQTLKYEKKIK